PWQRPERAFAVAAVGLACCVAGCSAGDEDSAGPGAVTLPSVVEPLHAPDAVCQRWTQDRLDLAEGTWSGDLATCAPGTWSEPARANALRQLNLYRWLAGRAAVSADPDKNVRAQSCALLLDANDQLSHAPPDTWACYSAAGAQGASESNIILEPGVIAVDLYMIDDGASNAKRMGHRRWLLWDALSTVGLGSSAGASCLLVLDSGEPDALGIRLWPPAGAFPHDAYAPRNDDATILMPTLDQGGWTIETLDMPMDSANVQLTEDGVVRPILVNALEPAGQSEYGLRFIPDGWTAKRGSTYEVTVTGIPQPFRYQVELVSCA
ncbi:MAG TPA: CAP domain-containing protein, partial [Polyangiaceae bacterium]|nr:CAP domain-containing protein [Polyangiaceae bacterium]